MSEFGNCGAYSIWLNQDVNFWLFKVKFSLGQCLARPLSFMPIYYSGGQGKILLGKCRKVEEKLKNQPDDFGCWIFSMESVLAYQWEVLMCPYDPILIHTHDPLSIYACVSCVCCWEYTYMYSQICDWNYICLCIYLWLVRLWEI